jgi:hypothetical protein
MFVLLILQTNRSTLPVNRQILTHYETILVVCASVFSSMCPSIWFITDVSHLISMNFGTEGPQYMLPGEFLKQVCRHVKKWVQTLNMNKVSAYNTHRHFSVTSEVWEVSGLTKHICNEPKWTHCHAPLSNGRGCNSEYEAVQWSNAQF